jgi:predicted Zn-dependent protease
MLDEATRDAILKVRDEAAARGAAAVFRLHRERSHLLRLGNNSVSLNTSEQLTRLDVEVTHGRRQGSHTVLGHVAGAETVRAALDTAAAKAAVATEKDYEPLTGAVEAPVAHSGQHDPALAGLEPAVKADAYRQVMEKVGAHYNYSGSWSSGETELYVVTTANRNEAWQLCTDQHFTVVLKHPEQRWELQATGTGWRAEDLDVKRLIERLQTLLPVYEGQPGLRLEPGPYTVVLGAKALADIVAMAAWTGLGGRGWEEKQGWTSQHKVGDPILGANISLVDDPQNAQTFQNRFDMQGRRRDAFRLVTEGVLAGLMYDESAAAKYGREPTGHDLYGVSLTMLPGTGPANALEAVAEMDRVLVIPALHYTHIPNRAEGLFTGSSRFNAVLVERGRVVRPIHSSRITDTFGNVLGNVRTLSSATVSVNLSNTYGRRQPVAASVPAYAVVEGVKITDSAESF